MDRRKAAVHNLGCKVNAYEAEEMQRMLEQAGYEIVPFAPGADVYVINTCTVTNIADRKSRQMLHRAKKMNPDAVVVAVGCYVQAAGEELSQDPSVDLVIGNNHKKDLVALLEDYEHTAKKSVTADPAHRDEDRTCTGKPQRTRAFLKVQDGCNQFCSYCIIPYTRGRVRSREVGEVREEVRSLAAQGCHEVVLTGIHLSSYGIDCESSLAELITCLHDIDGILRIRLGSLEPGIVTEPFVRTLARLPKVCPHFHLSLQSGCDATLRRMNRRYTSGEYYEKCCLLRETFSDPALTTDVIVGFPGETQAEFEQTREFLNRVDFYETHIFSYSRRKGTRAADMDGQVAPSVMHERSACLIRESAHRQKVFEDALRGRKTEVLFEERIEADGVSYAMGYTAQYVRMLLLTQENMENCLQRVRVTGQRVQGLLVCEKTD